MRIVILASGDGSNFEAIVKASQSGELKAQVVGLVTSRPGIGALARAERLSVPSQVLALKDFSSRDEWDKAVLAQLQSWNADWVVLAGYLSLIGPRVLQAFPERLVNIHPSLLPKFGGAGMYGNKVHAAVLQAKESQTGITVHLIDAQYDQGRVVAQCFLPVLADDTVERLAARVRAQENLFYPRVLNGLISGS
jgi:phosphoribosylglycinamide formyltransferase-1